MVSDMGVEREGEWVSENNRDWRTDSEMEPET